MVIITLLLQALVLSNYYTRQVFDCMPVIELLQVNASTNI